MSRIELLKKKKEQQQLLFLDSHRKRTKKSDRVLNLLETDAYSIDEIAEKLQIPRHSAYNAARRLEKHNMVIATDFDGKLVFLSKKKAKDEGLI